MAIFYNPDIKLGCHIGKLPTYEKTFSFIQKEAPHLSAYQLYVANSRSFTSPKFELKDLLRGRKLIAKNETFCVIHGSLTHNLCGCSKGPTEPKYPFLLSSTITKLRAELDIALALGINGVVVHFGTEVNKDRGKKRMGLSLSEVLRTETPEIVQLSKEIAVSVKDLLRSRRIILENSAGEGNDLGWDLKEVAEIISLVQEKEQLDLCIDTAHTFAAGVYDLREKKGIDELYEELKKLGLLKRLVCFHFNDSKKVFGSRVDRHESLTRGEIWSERDKAFCHFISQAEKHKIPLICEPPKDGDGLEEFETVREKYSRLCL